MTATAASGPRIALVHALAESVEPIHEAFAREWPGAVTFDLLDTSLSRDLAHAGSLRPDMVERFLTLGRYAASTSGEGGATKGVLFTCSAFGPAIDAVKSAVSVPVLRPNEAAFERALARGGRIGLLVTFEPSLAALERELHAMARSRGMEIQVTGRVVKGALQLLSAGHGAAHDQKVVAAVDTMPTVDTLILGQFSLARAAAVIPRVDGREVLTTPSSAVAKMRELLRPSTTPT